VVAGDKSTANKTFVCDCRKEDKKLLGDHGRRDFSVVPDCGRTR
jgi:hypothetical protein